MKGHGSHRINHDRCVSVILMSVLMCALVFPACSRQPDPGVTQIELWTLSLRPRFSDYMEQVLSAFEDNHPGVKVKWVDVPFEAINRKLIAAAVAGKAPDVVNLSDLQFARFASLGATADLTGLLPIDPDRVYLAGALAPARIDGKLGALPWYLTTTVRLINAGLLEEAGWKPQQIADNWPELQQQARAYHKQTGRFLFTQALAVESELPTMLIADGRPPFTERNGKLRADLTRGDVVDYIDGWVRLYRDGALPRAAATAGHAHVVEHYQNRQIAVAITGANFLSRIADAAPDVFHATTVRTPITGRLGRAHIAAMFLSVMSTSEHPRESAALAAWLTSPDNQLAFCKLVNIMPSTPEVLSDPHFAEPAQADDSPEYKLALARALSAQAMPTAVAFTPSLGAWPDLRRAFNEGIKDALLNGKDTRDTLASIEDQWNQILDDAMPTGMDVIPQPGPVHEDRHDEEVGP